MPEYLAPGVYIEETSYRAKSIEGVATSTTGFLGPTAWGPTEGPARLVTSFTEFAAVFGGLEELDGGRVNYLAYAARSYFENGGKRLYVARVMGANAEAARSVQVGDTLTFRARQVGSAGNALKVTFSGTRGAQALTTKTVEGGEVRTFSGLVVGDLVEVSTTKRSARFSAGGRSVDRPDSGRLYLVEEDGGSLQLRALASDEVSTADSFANQIVYVQRIDLVVTVTGPGYAASYAGLSLNPAQSSRYIGTVLCEDDPPDSRGRIWVEVASAEAAPGIHTLLTRLLAQKSGVKLDNGKDGDALTVEQLAGYDENQLPTSGANATGLQALEEIEDIAIVAAPGNAGLKGAEAQALRDALLGHCERLRYRFAILSADEGDNNTEDIRAARSTHDSSYGALYYPWVNVLNPDSSGTGPLGLPPEGFIAGIYARSDGERGVHKAPANEIVRGALSFAVPISQGTQEVLNPEGINCMRFFEGRGNRVWGARTLSSDPEWKYLNVRRLFIYMEHSIDKSTQWAVFEPNNETLWKKVTLTIESFLTDVWRTGALMGATAKEAFFVRCDRSTMTQGDLDNGRMVCLIGVAPTKPAEFVIFRIGQWTAEASTL